MGCCGALKNACVDLDKKTALAVNITAGNHGDGTRKTQSVVAIIASVILGIVGVITAPGFFIASVLTMLAIRYIPGKTGEALREALSMHWDNGILSNHDAHHLFAKNIILIAAIAFAPVRGILAGMIAFKIPEIIQQNRKA